MSTSVDEEDTPPSMTTSTTTKTTLTTLAPVTHELERQLRTLSLSGTAQTLLARNQEAISHQLAYTEFLELLVSDEFARRRDRLFTRRLKPERPAPGPQPEDRDKRGCLRLQQRRPHTE
jgi:hypothetical protein